MMLAMGSEAEFRVWELAVRQHGYVTRQQALASGMTQAMIRRRVRTGTWKVARTGLYLLPGHRQTLRGLLAAATSALGAVVSHESAAEIHGMSYVQKGLAVVTVPTRTTNRFPDVVVHQLTDLTKEMVIEVDHLPVTCGLRTVIDLAAVVGLRRIERTIDQCLAQKLFTIGELRRAVDAVARRGKPGTTSLRVVLAARLPGYVPPESQLEAAVLDHFRQWGFPDPVRQLALPWRSPRSGRVDFAYPHARLIIEVDGRAWHTTMQAFDEDRMRDNLAQVAGWRVIRITYRMLMERPHEVRRLIATALGLTTVA